MITSIAIDDEPLALQLITGYIEKTPALTLADNFDNPLDATEFLSNNEVDLIFVDIQMPDLSGIEFTRLLEKDQRLFSPRPLSNMPLKVINWKSWITF